MLLFGLPIRMCWLLLWQIMKIFFVRQTYLEVGMSANNSLRFINVTKLAVKLGPLMCQALTGLHCLTGCDHTPAFSRKGKIRPLAILEKNQVYQEAFASLGCSEEINETVVSNIEMFVCEMYGIKNKKGQLKKPTVNEARLELFTRVYQSTSKRPMSKVKGIDGSALPPCKSVLEENR